MIRRNFKLISLFVLFLLFLSVLIDRTNYQFKKESKSYIANIKDTTDQRMSFLSEEVNNFLKDAGNDIYFFVKFSNFSGENAADLKNEFAEFLERNPDYCAVSYFDKNNNEVIREPSRDNVFDSVDFSQGEYFSKISKLSAGDIFFTGIKKYQRSENDVALAIWYGAPVFDQKNSFIGSVLFCVDIEHLFNDVKNFSKRDEKIMIVDSRGQYLLHSDKSKDFSQNFSADYPGAAEAIINNSGRYFADGNQEFFARRVYPIDDNFAIYKGTKKIVKDDYFWIVLSAYNADELYKAVGNIKQDYFGISLFFGTLLIFMALLVVLIIKERDGR